VRVQGATADAVTAGPLSVTTCDGDPVTLDGGDHEVRTAVGVAEAIDIDRLLLRSAAGGEASSSTDTLVEEARAASLTAAGTDASGATASEAAASPAVEVIDEGHDHTRVRVTGAQQGEPFWLVLGQSFNEGWTASVEGDELPDPQMVDGFANGWEVVAPGESFEVEMRFAPQRRVGLALWLSAVAAVVCVALALRRPRPVTHFPSAMPEPYSPVLAWRYEGALPSRRAAVLTGAGLGVVSWVLAGPVVAVAVGVAAGLGARYETFRRWLLMISPVALGVAGCYVLYIQLRHSPMPSFEWPIEMRRVHPLGWAAVLFLVADVVVDRVWQSRRSDE
jgi:arabinofuranan 3-O-arabinosyltransferase